MRYWLIKSEPSEYSIADLKRDKTVPWTGVRNFAARNNLKRMQIGDLTFFYHSSTEPIGIAGLARVASKPYPDPSQFNKKSDYFDPKAKREAPTWYLVDFEFIKKFPRVFTLEEIKADPKLGTMILVKRPRLSVQPVTKEEYEYILNLFNRIG